METKTLGLVFLLVSIFLIGFFVIDLFNTKLKELRLDPTSKCEDACKSFNLPFYRIERVSTYANVNEFCWCIKEGMPYSLGRIE